MHRPQLFILWCSLYRDFHPIAVLRNGWVDFREAMKPLNLSARTSGLMSASIAEEALAGYAWASKPIKA